MININHWKWILKVVINYNFGVLLEIQITQLEKQGQLDFLVKDNFQKNHENLAPKAKSNPIAPKNQKVQKNLHQKNLVRQKTLNKF